MELTRGVDPALLAALRGPFHPVALVYLDWPVNPVRVHSGRGPIVMNGQTFTGLGGIGAIEVPGEGMTFAAAGAVLRLIGATADVYALEDEQIRNRAAVIWSGAVTAAGGNTLIGNPCMVFSGFMDALKFSETMADGTLRVGVELSLGTGPGARSRAAVLHSYEDQIAAYPGDTGGRGLINLTDRLKVLTWPE